MSDGKFTVSDGLRFLDGLRTFAAAHGTAEVDEEPDYGTPGKGDWVYRLHVPPQHTDAVLHALMAIDYDLIDENRLVILKEGAES
jgi:hypothetical protein